MFCNEKTWYFIYNYLVGNIFNYMRMTKMVIEKKRGKTLYE